MKKMRILKKVIFSAKFVCKKILMRTYIVPLEMFRFELITSDYLKCKIVMSKFSESLNVQDGNYEVLNGQVENVNVQNSHV